MEEKNKNKYVTISEGVDFRTIAKIMSKHGYKMNHATARNILISAIKRIMEYAADKVGASLTSEQIEAMIKEQQIHMALADVLLMAHKENSEYLSTEEVPDSEVEFFDMNDI